MDSFERASATSETQISLGCFSEASTIRREPLHARAVSNAPRTLSRMIFLGFEGNTLGNLEWRSHLFASRATVSAPRLAMAARTPGGLIALDLRTKTRHSIL